MNRYLILEFNEDSHIPDELKNESGVLLKKKSNDKNLIEWLTFGFIALYIIKPFSETFFKEAGKDFYKLVKSTIQSFFTEKNKGRNIVVVVNYKNIVFKYIFPIKERIENQITLNNLLNGIDKNEELDNLILNSNKDVGDQIVLQYNAGQEIWEQKD